MRLIVLVHVLLFALVGCSGPAGATASASEPIRDPHRLYVAKCASCHKLYDPTHYSDAEWNKWMKLMSRKARLKPDQKDVLSAYLDTLRNGTNAVPPHSPEGTTRQ